VVPNGPDGPDWQAIDRLLAEWRPTALVVGLPYNADGSAHAVTAAAQAFADALGARSGLTVHTIDERLSSATAAATLRDQRQLGRKRAAKGELDAEAAAVILGTFLASRT
jgi:putative Holliday junction resolvase